MDVIISEGECVGISEGNVDVGVMISEGEWCGSVRGNVGVMISEGGM